MKMIVAALFVGCIVDFARKNSLLRPARVFHRVSDLRFCAAEPFARVAAGNRGRRRRAGRRKLIMSDTAAILARRARRFCHRAAVFLHSRRPDQSHHPQRRLAARLSAGRCSSAWARRSMEVIYCAISFTGFSSLFDHPHRQGVHGGVQLCLPAVHRRQISAGAKPSAADQAGHRVGKNRDAPRARNCIRTRPS